MMHGMLLFIFIIGFWFVSITVCQIPNYIFPHPIDILLNLYHQRWMIGYHALITIFEIVSGVFIGGMGAIIMAIFMSHSKRAHRLLLPLLSLFQAVPPFVFIPILIMVGGFGMGPKITVIALGALFPITTLFLKGLLDLPDHYHDLMQYGSSSYFKLKYIQIPHALPNLKEGFRLAVTQAPMNVLAADWMGSSEGLGYLILRASGRMDIDQVISYVVVLMIIALTLHTIIKNIPIFYEGKQ
jgi:putative hydroxymethylpyrimidine transport system permease protein